MRRPLGFLLLLISTVSSLAEQPAYGEEAVRLEVDGLLTQHLFDLPRVDETLQEHVRRLKGWQVFVPEIESRLDQLETSQRLAAKQLASATERLEDLSKSVITAREELVEVTTANAGTTAAMETLRADLTPTISGVGGSAAELASSLTTQHGQTRGVCRGERHTPVRVSHRAVDRC